MGMNRVGNVHWGHLGKIQSNAQKEVNGKTCVTCESLPNTQGTKIPS